MTLEVLNGHLDMVLQLAEARDALETAQAKILGAVNYDGMPHANAPSRRPENLANYLEGCQENVTRLEKIVKRSEVEIKAFINGIPNPKVRNIFNLRFLCGMRWEDVANYIGGYNTYDSVRSACYRYLNTTEPPQ